MVVVILVFKLHNSTCTTKYLLLLLLYLTLPILIVKNQETREEK